MKKYTTESRKISGYFDYDNFLLLLKNTKKELVSLGCKEIACGVTYSNESGGWVNTYVEISGKRLETDKEFDDRIAREDGEKAYRRKLYEGLKKEFGE